MKEKEAKIEQLLKERDMERKEIAKAASQTEDAEKSLELLRENYLAYKAQSTQQVMITMISAEAFLGLKNNFLSIFSFIT